MVSEKVKAARVDKFYEVIFFKGEVKGKVNVRKFLLRDISANGTDLVEKGKLLSH